MKKAIRSAAHRLATTIARKIPPFKGEKGIEAMAPLLSIPVVLPRNHHQLPEDFGTQFISVKSIPARYVFELRNVCISGDGVVFKNGRIFGPSLTWLKDLHLHRNGKLLLRQWMGNRKRLPESALAALVYDQWSAVNYYHWMIESLPRLLLVRKYFPDCIILMPDPAPDFILATGSLLGVTNLLPLQREKGSVLQVPHLVMPELVYYDYTEAEALARKYRKCKPLKQGPTTNSTAAEGELIVEVRNTLLSQFPAPDKPPSKQFYISRSRQRTRRLLNENEAVLLLGRFGFEVLYFEEMSFQEQVLRMREASVIAGVHGANMVNILFLPPSAKVIELMNEHVLNDAYYLLASSLSIPYYSLPCAVNLSDPSSFKDSVQMNDADLWVNLDELEQVLLLALA